MRLSGIEMSCDHVTGMANPFDHIANLKSTLKGLKYHAANRAVFGELAHALYGSEPSS